MQHLARSQPPQVTGTLITNPIAPDGETGHRDRAQSQILCGSRSLRVPRRSLSRAQGCGKHSCENIYLYVPFHYVFSNCGY